MCKTAVKEVSLYRNGCLVKRRGIVELINGKQTVVFENIPDSIDPSTVRLALPEGVTGTNIQTETLTAQQKQEATAEIRKKIARIDKSIEIKNAQIEMLNANADFSAKENVNMNDVVSYIVSLPDHLEKLYDEIEELNEKKKELTKQQQDLQKLTNCFRIRADITADKEGKCPVELRYYDRNRWWNPVYEIYTSEEEDKLSIKLKADIHQNSIENWEDVRMILFTGNPQISGNIPQLYPQYLNFYEPRMYKTSARNAVMGAKVAMQAEMMVDEECEACEDTAEMPVMFDAVSNSRAVAVQNDTMMEYELDGLWTVTNENSTNADLQITEIPCRYHVVCVPKGDELGYLAGEVKTTDIDKMFLYNRQSVRFDYEWLNGFKLYGETKTEEVKPLGNIAFKPMDRITQLSYIRYSEGTIGLRYAPDETHLTTKQQRWAINYSSPIIRLQHTNCKNKAWTP